MSGQANPPGWQADPFGRHQHRYWDGTQWTDQVADEGVQSTDSPGDQTAAIRPEDIVPVEAKSKSDGNNVLQVNIQELEFLGAFWRAWLANDELSKTGLKANFSINAARRLELSEGKTVPKEFSAPEVISVLKEYYDSLEEKVEIKLHGAATGDAKK